MLATSTKNNRKQTHSLHKLNEIPLEKGLQQTFFITKNVQIFIRLAITITDVREIFEVIMPKRKLGENEILKLIEQKHKARHSAKKSHHKQGK